MIGLVLVTHGRLADEFIAAMEHVVGPQEQIATICIDANDDMEQKRNDIAESVDRIDDGSGVIVLTDMFGGTPSNLSITVSKRPATEVIAGVNLPMLIKLASIRGTMKLTDAIAEAQTSGRKYIAVASQILAQNDEKKK